MTRFRKTLGRNHDKKIEMQLLSHNENNPFKGSVYGCNLFYTLSI